MFRTQVRMISILKMHFLDSCGFEHAESGAAAESFEFLLSSLLFSGHGSSRKITTNAMGTAHFFKKRIILITKDCSSAIFGAES